jgi:hypothetical protein
MGVAASSVARTNPHRSSPRERFSPRARPDGLLARHRAGRGFYRDRSVITKDRVLIARHENKIGGTTDVAAHPNRDTARSAAPHRDDRHPSGGQGENEKRDREKTEKTQKGEPQKGKDLF